MYKVESDANPYVITLDGNAINGRLRSQLLHPTNGVPTCTLAPLPTCENLSTPTTCVDRTCHELMLTRLVPDKKAQEPGPGDQRSGICGCAYYESTGSGRQTAQVLAFATMVARDHLKPCVHRKHCAQRMQFHGKDANKSE